MSSGERKPDRRERALERAARRRRLLKIEIHRIKADLARLEAQYEDEVADELSRRLGIRPTGLKIIRTDALRQDRVPSPHATFDAPGPANRVERKRSRTAAADPPPPELPLADLSTVARSREFATRARLTRRPTRPLLMSFALHAVVLILCLPLSFATLSQDNFVLFATTPEVLDETTSELTDIEIETTPADDTELQNVALDQPEFNLTDYLLDDISPMDSIAETQNVSQFGQTDSIPADLGTLMTGAGQPDGGKAGGPEGSAIFFGAKSRGDRFVFVVDNSSSMKNGRLEGAIRELVASVDAMTRRQSFYVIFVSDQPYPMFYPEPAPGLLPATGENKKRLGEWLTRVRLASGKNREIIKAMDLAASLQPHAVFLLWDGDMRYSAKVRRDVMTHLTRPNQWRFAIHTLGMGIESLDSEHDLRAIAAAHVGTFQRVDLPPLKPR